MKKKLQYETLRAVKWISDAQMSPDGARAAYVCAESDYKTGKNLPRVYEIEIARPEPKPISRATARQTRPAYSPDGKYLSFLSDDAGFPRLYLLDRETREEKLALSARYGVVDYVWSPDGASIAFVVKHFPDKPGEDVFCEMTEAEYAQYQYDLKNAPHVAENLIYKFDDAHGFLEKSVPMVGVLNVADLSRRVLTPDAFAHFTPSWSDDCQYLYCYGRPHSHAQELDSELYRIAVATGEIVKLNHASPVMMEVPMLDAGDGNALYVGFTKYEDSWQAEPYAASASDAPEESLWPKDAPCQGVGALISGDNHMGEAGSRFRKARDGMVYFLSACDGWTNLYRIEGARCALVRGNEGCVTGFCAPVNGKILFLKSTWHTPRELYLYDMNTKTETRLTRHNAWTEEFALIKPFPIRIDAGTDGDGVSGYVVMPEDVSGTCGCVLYIHGGPESFFAKDGFLFDAQMMAAKGLAVAYCDPRGSFGYGVRHMKSDYSWGTQAVDDLMAFLDAAIGKFPAIDPDRLGVTGGSYGGYMTNKLTIVSDRFRAAAAQRTFVDPATSYGTGDMGFITGSGKTDFKKYMTDRAKNSVLRDIGNIKAATLLLHGEARLTAAAWNRRTRYLPCCARIQARSCRARLVIFPRRKPQRDARRADAQSDPPYD